MGTTMFSAPDRAFNIFLSNRAQRHVGRNENVGPAELINLAAHAVVTGDQFLAAQIMSRLNSLPKCGRSLTMMLRQELESLVVGDGVVKALEAIEIAKTRSRSASGKTGKK